MASFIVYLTIAVVYSLLKSLYFYSFMTYENRNELRSLLHNRCITDCFFSNDIISQSARLSLFYKTVKLNTSCAVLL